MNEALAKNAVAPLILRLALAVIFIYHGATKISGKFNDWGATWADHLTSMQKEPPPEVLARLQQWNELEKGRPAPEGEQAAEPMLPPDVNDRIRAAYAALAAQELAPKESAASALQLHASVQLLVAWGELLGGIALLLGILTRWAAAAMVVIQLGAIATVTGARGFSFADGGGYEYNLALLAMCLCVIVLGGGLWALDRSRGARVKAKTAAEARVPVAAG